MTFAEYLEAAGESLLRKRVLDQPHSEQLPEILHQRLLDHVSSYMLLGGMPAVLQSFVSSGDILACQMRLGFRIRH
jgi:hypothetical protein